MQQNLYMAEFVAVACCMLQVCKQYKKLLAAEMLQSYVVSRMCVNMLQLLYGQTQEKDVDLFQWASCSL